MSFAPYLGFAGTARAAMTFYADVFGATDLEIMSFADVPPDAAMPGADPTHVMHSQLTAGPGAPLMAADVPPHMVGMGGALSVFHAAPDAARAAEIFNRLAEGGSVSFPMGPTFWSPAFGGVTDKFGTAWMITVVPATA
jgi:PhnB protein